MKGDRCPCVDCFQILSDKQGCPSIHTFKVTITKLDRHFYGLFWFMAIKDSDVWLHSPNPETTFCIKRAIRWLHANNHLYSSFFSSFETLLRYVKPEFINPNLLDDLNL